MSRDTPNRQRRNRLQRTRQRRVARDGFTFAEMLLVLAILLIVTGVVFPPVLRMMADQPLKEGAERARVQLASVRLKALDSSAPWQLRFEPGGRHFLWMPTETAAATSNASSTSTTATSATAATEAPTVGELPKGINFSNDVNGNPVPVERLPEALILGLPNAYQLAQVGWSAPLTFQADGSSADSELAVVDARNQQIRLTVRGFTGGVTVSTIETRRRQ